MLKENWKIYSRKEENRGSRKSETKLRRQNKNRMVVKGNSDAISGETGLESNTSRGNGAQKAPDRPCKGMDEVFRILDVLDALRKDFFDRDWRDGYIEQ